jgi:two-component system response regulator AlgR
MRLRVLCEARTDVEVVGMAANGEEALELARLFSPDLMLMDIAMPDFDGLAAARLMESFERRPAVVFCTAYLDYALAAFDVDAVDYLLKPIPAERLSRAIERVRRLKHPPLLDGTTRPRFISEIWAPHLGAMRKIPITDIERIEAEGDYVRLITPPRSYLLHEAIVRLEQKLDPASFIRLRRSVIIRRDTLVGLRSERLNVWIALLKDGGEVRIGPTYVAKVKSIQKA